MVKITVRKLDFIDITCPYCSKVHQVLKVDAERNAASCTNKMQRFHCDSHGDESKGCGKAFLIEYSEDDSPPPSPG